MSGLSRLAFLVVPNRRGEGDHGGVEVDVVQILGAGAKARVVCKALKSMAVLRFRTRWERGSAVQVWQGKATGM